MNSSAGIKKQFNTKIDGSNERNHETKNSKDNMRNRNDQWVEEQKANFEMTYLQPLKIR